ncbi:MAG: hypothetical protein KJO11_09800, partial [Gemmatimonadetes bacterium]|nr:hypothetical protein [Gemmatimonadota bacterium]
PGHPGTLLPPFEADAVAHSSAGWALLDRTAGEILRLDGAGDPIARFGRRGEGPGELSRPLHIGLDRRGTVAVLDASGRHLDIFPTASRPAVRVSLPAAGCPGSFGDAVVHFEDAWWVARRCFEGPRSELEIVRANATGAADVEARTTLTRMNTDPHLTPLLVASGGELFMGSNRDPCLTAVGGGARLCLPRPPAIAIADTTADRMFGDLGRRAAAVGIDLELPTHYPGLVAARSRASGPALRTIRADGSDAWAVVESDTMRVLVPVPGGRVEPGETNWLLLRDDGAGLRIWVVADEPANSSPSHP